MSVGAEHIYDVVVVGAGVVGCAVARELAGHSLSVALVEARDDVGDATSKANTAILHTGFDATPGTLEAQLVSRGYQLLLAYAERTGIPVERLGAVLVAWTEDEAELLPTLQQKAEQNGYRSTRLLDAAEVYAIVPALAHGVHGGLIVPDESIICPWTTTLAFAHDSLARGVSLLLDHAVQDVDVREETTTLRTSRGEVVTRWVVNAAGLGADHLDRRFGHHRFTVVPRRGELIVFDKLAGRLVDSIVLPVPSSRGKGVLVSPTIYGNVMLGPTSEDLTDRTDTSTSEAGLSGLLEKGRALMPDLLTEEVTASYAGLRASTEHSDFVIDVDPRQRYLLLGGIRSTGLSASMAIAEHTCRLLADSGVPLDPRSDLPAPPKMPMIGERFTRPYQRGDLIAQDSSYGTIVCFCERVTKGEVRDALESPLPPRDLDGLRRRTRAMMGRCQGFYCGASVDAMLRESQR